METKELLQTRGSSHGDFRRQFDVAQKLKMVCFDEPSYLDMDPVLREAIEMDLMKLSRILTGQPLFEDHWADRCGYLALALKRVQELQAAINLSWVDAVSNVTPSDTPFARAVQNYGA